MYISKSCSPKIAPFISTQKYNNDLQNEYHRTWDNNYTKQTTQPKLIQTISRRNQFIDMSEAALEPKKIVQRKIMEIWKKFSVYFQCC